jgi:hypothetical protein
MRSPCVRYLTYILLYVYICNEGHSIVAPLPRSVPITTQTSTPVGFSMSYSSPGRDVTGCHRGNAAAFTDGTSLIIAWSSGHPTMVYTPCGGKAQCGNHHRCYSLVNYRHTSLRQGRATGTAVRAQQRNSDGILGYLDSFENTRLCCHHHRSVLGFDELVKTKIPKGSKVTYVSFVKTVV